MTTSGRPGQEEMGDSHGKSEMGDSHGKSEMGDSQGETTPEPSPTPLLPSLGKGGHWWIAVLTFLVAAAALVWRCG